MQLRSSSVRNNTGTDKNKYSEKYQYSKNEFSKKYQYRKIPVAIHISAVKNEFSKKYRYS